MINLSTDPIHREDYRGATKYIDKNYNMEKDSIIYTPEFDYYWFDVVTVRNSFRGVMYSYFDDFDGTDNERIFIMSNYSMMPANNAKDLKRYQEQLPGFHMEKMVKFGGVDGHTVVYIFRRNND